MEFTLGEKEGELVVTVGDKDRYVFRVEDMIKKVEEKVAKLERKEEKEKEEEREKREKEEREKLEREERERQEREKAEKEMRDRFMTYCNHGIYRAKFGGSSELIDWLTNIIPKLDEDLLFDGFVNACEQGLDLGVKTMLKSGKIDPCAKSNTCLLKAIKSNHSYVVDALLDDPRVIASNPFQIAIEQAQSLGHMNLAMSIQRRAEVIEKRKIHAEFLEYCKGGFTDVKFQSLDQIRTWLQSTIPKIDTEVLRDGFATACSNGYPIIVEALLKSNRIDPCINSNAALVSAIKESRSMTINTLLSDPRVLASDLDRDTAEYADKYIFGMKVPEYIKERLEKEKLEKEKLEKEKLEKEKLEKEKLEKEEKEKEEREKAEKRCGTASWPTVITDAMELNSAGHPRWSTG